MQTIVIIFTIVIIIGKIVKIYMIDNPASQPQEGANPHQKPIFQLTTSKGLPLRVAKIPTKIKKMEFPRCNQKMWEPQNTLS